MQTLSCLRFAIRGFRAFVQPIYRFAASKLQAPALGHRPFFGDCAIPLRLKAYQVSGRKPILLGHYRSLVSRCYETTVLDGGQVFPRIVIATSRASLMLWHAIS